MVPAELESRLSRGNWARGAISSQSFNGDDFYAPMEEQARVALSPECGYMRYFDWVRVRRELLEPLSRGDGARYQRYDWGMKQLAEWIDQPAEGIILIDGVYSYRPELRKFYGYSICVDTPKAECLARLARRGEEHGGMDSEMEGSGGLLPDAFRPGQSRFRRCLRNWDCGSIGTTSSIVEPCEPNRRDIAETWTRDPSRHDAAPLRLHRPGRRRSRTGVAGRRLVARECPPSSIRAMTGRIGRST